MIDVTKLLKIQPLLPIAFCMVVGACGSSGNGAADVMEDQGQAEDLIHIDADIDGTDDVQPGEDTNIGDSGPPTEKRNFSFRVIAGVSMGANAVTIAAHHPEEFDVVGSMGGYVDNRYLAHMMEYFFLGGFCPMDQVLDNLDHVNEADNPDVFCGPVEATMPWEHEWSYNHFHYDNSGGSWGRDFLVEMMEGFMYAFGNMLYYNPDNPIIPPGMTLEWWNDEKDKCANPMVIGKPYNYHGEFNPKGEYDLITYCDGDTIECDEKSLACLDAKGAYEPDKPHAVPVRFMFAVDYNGNGKRDYGEPVIHKAHESFEDTGTDGCSDEFEDGQGGCDAVKSSSAVDDPNGDNFDLFDNPSGTEGNFDRDDGEPFDDLGLDGVSESVAEFKDYGEGNKEFDRNPRVDALIASDARTFFNTAPIEAIRRINWYFDGGIRDSLHALTLTMHLSNALKLRGLDVREYDDFANTDDSLFPEATCDDFLGYMNQIDFSSQAMGRNVLIRYGNPDASDAEIVMGDGKHVGLACQMANRLLVFFAMAGFRLPDPIIVADGDNMGETINTSTWSKSLDGRVRYSISLPPGYNTPGNEDKRYPLMIFLPGHGMGGDVMVMAGTLFNMLMAQGTMPRFILLAPEGQCCHVNRDTGTRYCGCTMGGKQCVDPDCKGPHETCEIIEDTGKLKQECNAGHFFFNHLTNRWAETDAAEVMKFEDSLFDVIADVDERFRTKKAAELVVPVEF